MLTNFTIIDLCQSKQRQKKYSTFISFVFLVFTQHLLKYKDMSLSGLPLAFPTR